MTEHDRMIKIIQSKWPCWFHSWKVYHRSVFVRKIFVQFRVCTIMLPCALIYGLWSISCSSHFCCFKQWDLPFLTLSFAKLVCYPQNIGSCLLSSIEASDVTAFPWWNMSNRRLFSNRLLLRGILRVYVQVLVNPFQWRMGSPNPLIHLVLWR